MNCDDLIHDDLKNMEEFECPFCGIQLGDVTVSEELCCSEPDLAEKNDKPIVHSREKNISSWIGHETSIQCRANGFPRPTFHWSGKGVVTNVILSKTTAQSTLTVTPNSQSDFSVYSCYARNSLGYDSTSFALVQLVTPDRPIIMHLESGSSFIRVTWKAPVNTEGKPVIGYLVQAIDENNPKNVLNCSDVINNRCTIHGLQPNTTYLVSVQATNAMGYGISAHEKVVTKDKGHSQKRKPDTDKGAKKGLSTGSMFIIVVASIGGAILFVVLVSLLVKRCRSTGKGSITKE